MSEVLCLASSKRFAVTHIICEASLVLQEINKNAVGWSNWTGESSFTLKAVFWPKLALIFTTHCCCFSSICIYLYTYVLWLCSHQGCGLVEHDCYVSISSFMFTVKAWKLLNVCWMKRSTILMILVCVLALRQCLSREILSH